jgi:hypothetical protein
VRPIRLEKKRFDISTPKRTYNIKEYDRDPDVIDEWVKAIQKAIEEYATT